MTRLGLLHVLSATAVACVLVALIGVVPDSESLIRLAPWMVATSPADADGSQTRWLSGVQGYVRQTMTSDCSDTTQATCTKSVKTFSAMPFESDDCSEEDVCDNCGEQASSTTMALLSSLMATGLSMYIQSQRANDKTQHYTAVITAVSAAGSLLYAALSFSRHCLEGAPVAAELGPGLQAVWFAFLAKSVVWIVELASLLSPTLNVASPNLNMRLMDEVHAVQMAPATGRKFTGGPVRVAGHYTRPTTAYGRNHPVCYAEIPDETGAEAPPQSAPPAAGPDKMIAQAEALRAEAAAMEAAMPPTPPKAPETVQGKAPDPKPVWRKGQTIKEMPGVVSPTGFFDPLGLTSDMSQERVRYFAEAEIKHGRVAMLAALGFLVGENFHPLWGGAINVPSYVAFQATPLQTFWPLVLAAIGSLEYFTSVSTFKNPGDKLWQLKDDHELGNIGFDPFGLKPKDAKALKDIQTKELSNGRLAMLGIAGMVGQELAKGKKMFGNPPPEGMDKNGYYLSERAQFEMPAGMEPPIMTTMAATPEVPLTDMDAPAAAAAALYQTATTAIADSTSAIADSTGDVFGNAGSLIMSGGETMTDVLLSNVDPAQVSEIAKGMVDVLNATAVN